MIEGEIMATNEELINKKRNGQRDSARQRQSRLTGEKNRRQQRSEKTSGQGLATGLAYFSLGLGLAELLAPKSVAKIAGAGEQHTSLIRFYGLREISSGIGILLQERPVEAVWSRVVGDAIDLATLGAAFAAPDSRKGKLAFATASVAGVTALDVLCALQLGSNAEDSDQSVQVRRSIVVNRTPDEIYQFWRDLENLPRFMSHLRSVRTTGDRRSHWVANAPAGTTVEWDAEITEDAPDRMIAWRSLEGSEVENSGSVMFEKAPGGRGTIVKVAIDYNPPAGIIGKAIAKLFGEEPGQQIADDLRRFKQVMETGEVVVSDATVAGTGYTQQRAAQPAADTEASKQTTPGLARRATAG